MEHAISKMAQGVEAAKAANGRQRAIELLEEAVKVDDKLLEARYDLGVLHVDGDYDCIAEVRPLVARRLGSPLR